MKGSSRFPFAPPAPPQGVSAGERAELQLQEHFQGKRDGQRFNIRVKVRVSGMRNEYIHAITIDISRSGILLKLLDDRFDEASHAGLLAYSAEIRRTLGPTIRVDFGGDVLTRRMEVVRTTVDEDGDMLLACRFRRKLGTDDCELLGVLPG